MTKSDVLSGKELNEIWGLNAAHALYSKGGKWYHLLQKFPAVLFDDCGYVIFQTEEDYKNSKFLHIQKEINIPKGISSFPNYIKISEINELISFSYGIKKIREKRVKYTAEKVDKSEKIPPQGKQVTNRSVYLIERVIRDTRVSSWVKIINEYRCQICGLTIQLPNGERYAESHHIKPLRAPHNGPDVVENILCVCPNHHVLLDYRAIKLEYSDLIFQEGHKVKEEYFCYHNNLFFMASK